MQGRDAASGPAIFDHLAKTADDVPPDVLFEPRTRPVAVAANTRGRDSTGWFIGAILFSPLVMGLMLLALPEFVGPIHLARGR